MQLVSLFLWLDLVTDACGRWPEVCKGLIAWSRLRWWDSNAVCVVVGGVVSVKNCVRLHSHQSVQYVFPRLQGGFITVGLSSRGTVQSWLDEGKGSVRHEWLSTVCMGVSVPVIGHIKKKKLGVSSTKWAIWAQKRWRVYIPLHVSKVDHRRQGEWYASQ
jgi:hypothetical protein